MVPSQQSGIATQAALSHYQVTPTGCWTSQSVYNGVGTSGPCSVTSLPMMVGVAQRNFLSAPAMGSRFSIGRDLQPGTRAALRLGLPQGQELVIIALNEAQLLMCYKGRFLGRERLVMAQASVNLTMTRCFCRLRTRKIYQSPCFQFLRLFRLMTSRLNPAKTVYLRCFRAEAPTGCALGGTRSDIEGRSGS